MSTTYSFVCDDCKIKCWAGQSLFIYKYRYVADFLHNHLGHNLRFISDHIDDERSENYEDIKDAYEDCE